MDKLLTENLHGSHNQDYYYPHTSRNGLTIPNTDKPAHTLRISNSKPSRLKILNIPFSMTTITVYLTLLLILSQHATLTLASYRRSGYFADTGYQTQLLTSNQHLPDWRHQEKIISKELLEMLGLKHKPKISGITQRFKSAPRFMMDLYKQLEFDKEDGRDSVRNLDLIHYNVSGTEGIVGRGSGDADLIMSFQNQVTSSRIQTGPDLLFSFSEVPATESVSHAELRFYKHPVFSATQKYDVQLYALIDEAQNNSEKNREIVATTSIAGDYHGWFDVEITATVKKWLQLPYSNTGLYITITDKKGVEVAASSIGVVDSTGPGELHTFLVAFFQAPEAVHVRQKRSVKERRSKKEGRSRALNLAENSSDFLNFNKCHREALYINFADLNWERWIIAPEGYAAFHCTGQCSFPLNSHMNATNHAIVQTLVSLMEPYRVPLPCCAPTKMTAISVLYFDDNSNVILKKYKNMEVKSCGCH